MKTINTFLPVFNGFYGTYFGNAIDSEEESILDELELNSDQVTFNTKQFTIDVAKECVGIFQDSFNRELGIKMNVTFDSIYSPKFYNFSNDEIVVSIEISDEDLQTIKNAVKENEVEISEMIKDKYQSRDGFASATSTDFKDWMEDFENEHKFGTLLEMLSEVLQIVSEEEMIDRMIGNVSMNYTVN